MCRAYNALIQYLKPLGAVLRQHWEATTELVWLGSWALIVPQCHILPLLPTETPGWIKRAQPFLPKPSKVPLNQDCGGLLTPSNKHNSPLLPKSHSALISTQKFLYHLSSFHWGLHTSVCSSLSPTSALSKRLVSRAPKWVTEWAPSRWPGKLLPRSIPRLLSSRARDGPAHACVDTHTCSRAPHASGMLWVCATNHSSVWSHTLLVRHQTGQNSEGFRYWNSSSAVPLPMASCGIHANWNTATIQGGAHALPPFPHQPFGCFQHCNIPWFILELEKGICTW